MRYDQKYGFVPGNLMEAGDDSAEIVVEVYKVTPYFNMFMAIIFEEAAQAHVMVYSAPSSCH